MFWIVACACFSRLPPPADSFYVGLIFQGTCRKIYVMLYKNTVSPAMWELMQRLMRDDVLKDFVLVGGTALSLKIGHRLSVDIDLFTKKNFNAQAVLRHLEREYQAEPSKYNTNSIMTFINDIKVDLISHKYLQVKPAGTFEDIRIVSIEDIGAMKLHAIVQSGKRYKDFVDMYYLLEHHPLQVYLDAYEAKYETNPALARNALLYHKNVLSIQGVLNTDGQEIKMSIVEDRLRKALINTGLLFGNASKEVIREEPPIQKRRGFRR